MIPVLARSAQRAFLLQLLLAAAVISATWYFIDNAAQNLVDLGVASGFGFLGREAGFAIGETTLVSYNAADTYLRAITVGVLNTFRVATLAIICATIIGVLIGLSRLSENWLLAKLAAAYVEVLRNVPLVVQLFFWYAVITESLPGPAEAFHPAVGIFLSNRGLAYPLIKLAALHGWLTAGLGAVLIFTLRFLHRGRAIVAATTCLAFVAAAWWTSVDLDLPEFAGFNFSGGALLSPEFTALFLGLALYTAAFIAEIVRAGILSVERGQLEAAYSLGLSRRQVTQYVVAPQALRVIVPPLTSQFLNCTKNSSLAVAIGYPDLVSVANTTINQTGQAIEGIAIIILVYLTISLGISALMNWYNRRVALRGHSG
jgi:general L-amino acid transport system permease protein